MYYAVKKFLFIFGFVLKIDKLHFGNYKWHGCLYWLLSRRRRTESRCAQKLKIEVCLHFETTSSILSIIVSELSLLWLLFLVVTMNTNVPLVDPVDSIAAEDGTQFIVALCHINRTLGIACYDELSNVIYADCLNISNDDTEETLNNIKTAFRPTLFLIHPRIISNKSLMDSLLLGPDGTPDFYKFKVLKSSNWNESITLQLILKQLVVKEDMTHRTSTSNNYQKLASRIELENEQVRQSLGALLSTCKGWRESECTLVEW